MIDSLFILGEDKHIVIEKHWKGVLERSVLEPFYVALNTCVDSYNIPPVLEGSEYVLVVVKENNLFFIATMKNENSPLMVTEFIKKIISLLKAYIGVVSEVKIRGNFSLVYQLLDEVSDFGVPVITEASIMTSLIPLPSIMNKALNFVTKVAGLNEEDTWLPGTSSNNVMWRRPDLKYARNEINFYIIEYINATITNKGQMSDCSAYGTLRVQSRLSQSPEITAALTGTETIEGIFLHNCVDRARFRSSKTLQFIPPDGVFDVMSYSVKTVKDLNLAFYVRPNLKWINGENGVWGQLELAIGSKPSKKEGNPVIAMNVMVELTFPECTSGANINSQMGKISFDQQEKKLQWYLDVIRKEDTPSLKGPVFLQAGAVIPKSCINVSVHFVQTGSSVSGLGIGKIQALRTKDEYNLVTNVSKQIQNGSYNIQM